MGVDSRNVRRYCISLQHATYIVAVWSTLYSLLQLSYFVWQIWDLVSVAEKAVALPGIEIPFVVLVGKHPYYPQVLFVCTGVVLALVFTSLGFIYGLMKWSRRWVLIWLVNMQLCILSIPVYCITAWSDELLYSWFIYTLCEYVALAINIACFIIALIFCIHLNNYQLYGYKERRCRDECPHAPRVANPPIAIKQRLESRAVVLQPAKNTDEKVNNEESTQYNSIADGEGGGCCSNSLSVVTVMK